MKSFSGKMWIWPGNILPHSIVWSERPHRIQMLWGSLQDVYLWCHDTALSYSFRGWFEWWEVFMAIVTRFEKKEIREIFYIFFSLLSHQQFESWDSEHRYVKRQECRTCLHGLQSAWHGSFGLQFNGNADTFYAAKFTWCLRFTISVIAWSRVAWGFL